MAAYVFKPGQNGAQFEELDVPARIRYVLYAARIVNLLSEDVLLAPASAWVIPLPQAMREKKAYIGFLMILMQRLATSSTRAIITTLEKRLGLLTADSADWRRFEASENHLRTDWGAGMNQRRMPCLFHLR